MGSQLTDECKNSSDMEDKIFDIVTDLLREDISKDEAIQKLLLLHNVSCCNIYFDVYDDSDKTEAVTNVYKNKEVKLAYGGEPKVVADKIAEFLKDAGYCS